MHRSLGIARLPIWLGVVLTAFAGCALTSDHHQHHTVDLGELSRAVAVLAPTAGNACNGTVRFVQTGSTVTVTADISGLPPGSEHAWHIHEFGDIRGADGKATGGHYNPEQHEHGLPDRSRRHAGDFGNLQSDAHGHAHAVITVDNITIAGGRSPILGRGVIVHAKRDDGGQPTGNAGARIAQGVIGVAKGG